MDIDTDIDIDISIDVDIDVDVDIDKQMHRRDKAECHDATSLVTRSPFAPAAPTWMIS